MRSGAPGDGPGTDLGGSGGRVWDLGNSRVLGSSGGRVWDLGVGSGISGFELGSGEISGLSWDLGFSGFELGSGEISGLARYSGILELYVNIGHF